MPLSVTLSMGIRTALHAMSDITGQQAIANKRLATGRKVNDALDGPLSYFLAKSFDKTKGDLGNLLDSQNLAQSTLQKVIKTTESIAKLVESLQALGRQARQSADDAAGGVREQLAGQIATILNQITDFTRDAGFNGRNLIGEVPDNLQIEWNAETGVNLTRIVVTGVSLTPNGAQLGFGTAAQGFATTVNAPPTPDVIAFTAGTWTNDAAGNARIDALVNQSQTALNRLQANAANFAVSLTILQTRLDYSKFQQRTLAQATDLLTLADVNEEGANLAALSTRQQLSVQALSLANQADQGILRLF